ncbi:ABC transporter ATP-binding protein/permease [Stutzerimonas kirkiae]|uniref:ABC transporter ATP-binding protein/permease n=1 Tax=Stutzerimonas kirkiae TaxID=2211392 RepID=A0A4Q9QYL7_9GAMM|nr:ABC transporter ATP-binding protein [Stutzerimonas kirkiae]TBU90066.1 ABC transporter ATP-binding protein/permease [Stutzerimonas kirkiae]TBU99074.1 ABC transporter ATP-binding protein/permease [Stutzerimonas kirkiae]TBV10191.1 ABC transporter ATP-binding protein/permease [Stutzerimonas kirkiae]
MNDTSSSVKATPRPFLGSWHRILHGLLRSTGQYAPRLRRSLLGLLFAAILQGLALACLFPLFDALLQARDGAATLFWLGALSLLAAAAAALRWYAQGFDFDGDMAAATHQLRTRLGEQLRRIPLEELQDRRSGDVNSALLGNVDENFNYVVTIADPLLSALLTPLVVAIAALLVDWRIGLSLLLISLAVIPLYLRQKPIYGAGTRKVAQANQLINAELVEYTQGLQVLRAAGREGEKASRLQDSFEHLRQVQIEDVKSEIRSSMLSSSIIELSVLLLVGLGIFWSLDGSLSLASLAAVLVIVVRFAEPLATFMNYSKVISIVEAALQRIDALLAIEPLPQRQPAQSPTGFEVRFEGVSFQYRQADRPALHELDVELPGNSLSALVGPSGSGKTTLTRLLMRHADPQSGTVRIGGVDIRHIQPEQLNRLISVVFQDVYLFDDSILANIRMARPDASDEEVEAAARAAHCHDFILRLADGYQTRVGDIGGRLSGGERQRISIARAILKGAPIVILDEPSAALDTESEVAVQRAIEALVRGRTVIVIAHRLSTIAAADRILVIEDGRLAEQGRHAELLAAGGRYQAMWQAQQQAKSWHLGEGH